MAFVCTLGMFTACSSDDDPTPTVWDNYQGGNYSVWGENLVTDEEEGLDNELIDLQMTVAKGDNNKANVTLKNSELEISVPAADIQADGSDIKLSGNGTMKALDASRATNQAGAAACTLNATIGSDNKVSVELTADGETFTATNDEKPAVSQLIGLWNTEPTVWYNSNGVVEKPTDDADEWAEGSFKLNWEAAEGTTINIDLGYGFPMPFPAETAAALAQRLANAQLGSVLNSVAFTTDGKIYAEYRNADSEDGKWLIAKDYATYQVVSENQILVFLNSDKITESVTDATQKATLQTILGMFKDGVPVNIRWSNNNQTAFFYVDKTFATALASSPVLAGIVENLKNEDLDGMGATIKSIVGQIPGLMESTTSFEAGLELVKE